MTANSFKIIINTPSKALFQFLQNNILYQNIDLFHLTELSEVEQYARRIQPKLVVMHIDHDPPKYETTLTTIRNLKQVKDLWLLLLLSDQLAVEQIRSHLPQERVFLQRSNPDYNEVLYNLLTIKSLDDKLCEQQFQNQYEGNINFCLKIIYQNWELSQVFEQLVNFFPKIIFADYWALFNIDKNMRHVDYFAQFIPPTRRQKAVLTHNLERLAEEWTAKGKPITLTETDNPNLFNKFNEWGWPITQIYFIPIRLKEQAIGGILAGNVRNRKFSAHELRFLNEITKLIADRILEKNFSKYDIHEINDFSDRLVSDHFDEESIFQHACKKLNEVTHASSAIFWQYNKGFGFLFPKYFYFLEESRFGESPEKNMIFFNKEKYLSDFIDSGRVQTLHNIQKNAHIDPATQRIFKRMRYNNMLILPLRLYQEITGALILNKHKDNHKFNVWEIHIAEEILKRTQKVLEDTQTVKEANFKLKQLSRIFELGKEVTLGYSLNNILARIATNLRKSLGWNDIAFLIKDEVGKKLRLSNKLGFHQNQILKFNLNKDISLSKFTTFLESCQKISNSYFHDSQPLKINNGDNLLSQTVAELPAGISTQTGWQQNDLLIVSLVTRNKILGYLLVHDPVDRLKPTVEKIIPLEYYANQAAVAVENADLYDKLRTSQEKYRSLAETMSLGLVTCDTAGKIVYVNPAFCDLLNYEEEEIISQPLANYFSKKSQESLKNIFDQLLDKKSNEDTRLENMEFTVMSQDNEAIPVSVFAFPFFERSKKTGFFLILNDLRMIKRLERMKADFNSMVVHDLRSPLNVIQGFIELIRNRVVGEVNSEQEELLDIAKENVKKVLALVDNFLVASKLDVGKFNIDRKLDEINAIIEQQVENHKVLVRNKNIQIHTELDRNLPLLYFDSLRIEQVLNNLLSNAMKFTPENESIYVNSKLLKKEVDGEEVFYACISIQDSGPGIPDEMIGQIFEKYEHADSQEGSGLRGTGLGLSICKEIVNLHNGNIWVENAPTKGSKFSFTLPIESSIEEMVK